MFVKTSVYCPQLQENNQNQKKKAPFRPSEVLQSVIKGNEGFHGLKLSLTAVKQVVFGLQSCIYVCV